MEAFLMYDRTPGERSPFGGTTTTHCRAHPEQWKVDLEVDNVEYVLEDRSVRWAMNNPYAEGECSV